MYVDGTSGNDANDGSSFDGRAVKTLAKALQIQAANKSATIYVKCSLSLSATASIPSGVTLFVASEGATISGSGNSVDGIVLKSGSALTGMGKLTMTDFKTALTSEKGSTITDGTYVLKGNAGKSGALFGAQASGSIVFGENCLVETPAKGNADNGAGQTGKNFVVTGGSYLVKYAPGYNSSYGGTFSKDSVFKKNPDVFDISTDKSGGKVATVNSSPKVSDKKILDGLLKSLSDNLRFSFVATFAAPDGVSLPTDLDAGNVTTHGFGDGFKVSDVKVSGKTVSVTFSLSDPDAIKTYSDLEKIVGAAGDGDGLMKLAVPGVVIDKDAEIGARHTIVGTVDGSFGATAESEAGTHKVFSFTWKGVQLADGKDAVATDDEVIQPTVKPVKSAEPNPSNPTPTKPTPTKPTPSNPSPTKSSTAKPTGSKGSGSARKPAGKPVVGKIAGRGSKGVPKTGDATLPTGVVGVMVLAGPTIPAPSFLYRRSKRRMSKRSKAEVAAATRCGEVLLVPN